MRLPLTAVFLFTACSAWAANPAATPAAFTAPKAELLDRAAFAQWVAGTDSPLAKDAKDGPQDVFWTSNAKVEWRGVKFGIGRETGVRHLRLGFAQAAPVGSVLVRGGGVLSVLKPGATYPGNLADDAQWIPAERL